MATQNLDPKSVIANFREWTVEEQIALVRSLIRELAAHERSALHQLSVYDLAGIAKTTESPPSDEQIDTWLEERRTKEA